MAIPATIKPARRTASTGTDGRNTRRKDRFDDLVSRVREVALSLGPGEKLPGVYEMRDSMGVSVATLTSALDELEARRVIVRRPGVGIFTSPNAGKRVVSLVCDPTFFRSGGGSPFWDMLIKQAQRRAASYDELLDLHFSSIIGDSLELPMGLMADVEAGRLSGVIYIGTFQRGVEWIERHGVPVVVFSGPGSHQCVIDDFAVIRMGAEDLASRGCRRIALMSGDERFTVPEHVAQYAQWRLDAFQDGLASAGAPLVPSLVRQVKATVSTGPWVPDVSPQRTGYDTARRWLALPVDERPDGIVVTDDQMTLGVIAAAQSLGRQVGHDFLIATHANADSATLIGWSERMTLMIVDPAELVAGLFGILESLIDGDSNAETLLKIEPNRFVGDDVPAKLPAAVAEPDC